MNLATAFRNLLRRGAPKIATQAAEHGGAVARVEREPVARQLEHGTTPKGARLPDTHAPKTGPPTEVRTINPETVTADASRMGRRLDLQPVVKPLAYGTAATVTLAGLGYAAQKVGDSVYHAGEEQLPYTQNLAGGGLLYTDPVTGETYVIVAKEGGAHHEDPYGPTGGGSNDAGGTGYEVVPVSEGNRADAKSQEAFFEGLFNPLTLLAIAAVAVVILIIVAGRGRGGRGGAK